MNRIITLSFLLLVSFFSVCYGEDESKHADDYLDIDKSLSAYASNAGDANTLGDMLHTGFGAPKNIRQAIIWYEVAAKAGHAGAQNSLGDIYYNGDGDGVEQNYNLAFFWYEKPAMKENTQHSQILLICI